MWGKSERIEDGVNGLLYQKGNIAELAEKIEILRDENVRKMLSKNIDSIAIEEKYGIDNFASSFCYFVGLVECNCKYDERYPFSLSLYYNLCL